MAAGVALLFLVAFTPLTATVARIIWQSHSKIMTGDANSATASLARAKSAGARVEFAVRFGAISSTMPFE
jgi:hypothetical protein